MTDSFQHDYRIRLLNGVEMNLKNVYMDGTDDKVILFLHGYSDVAAIINKEALEFVFQIPERTNL